MKILAIYPGLNPVFDEVVYALVPLVESGNAVRVLTTRGSGLKSSEQAGGYENFHGVEINRLYHAKGQDLFNGGPADAEALRLVDEFRPDFLFVNSANCLRLANLIRRKYDIPTLLRLEASDPLTLMPRRKYLGVPWFGREIVGRALWSRLVRDTDAIMVNDPNDVPLLAGLSRRGAPVFYAGHCAQQPAGLELPLARDRDEMIYIGSLIRHKNCELWLRTVPAILENTPVKRFTIIGRGPFEHIVKELTGRYGDRIVHLPGVTRVEALQRLASAWFAYTASTTGWGFLCDAWSTGTPVLCPQSQFNIIPGWSGMMPQTEKALVSTVNRLYEDSSYYAAMQEGGRLRYDSEHTASVVAKQYAQIIRETVAVRA
ncbi:glycosyltransferase involved in cell wall biosynthesis [Pseudoduganella lurida]|uniref:Glycosyltransferase involved in cell wall biosynthesis n=1 Tax=Pseudoduganella lurida TaxID=1036180 RepID=A0A562R7U3_9BURK|nr:glycosyltransferase [Pseudoduganella lurida]TWI65142.1 glycosyltransferase involved in cell wall biosynthesis [Pseudoduganella lurida]